MKRIFSLVLVCLLCSLIATPLAMASVTDFRDAVPGRTMYVNGKYLECIDKKPGATIFLDGNELYVVLDGATSVDLSKSNSILDRSLGSTIMTASSRVEHLYMNIKKTASNTYLNRKQWTLFTSNDSFVSESTWPTVTLNSGKSITLSGSVTVTGGFDGSLFKATAGVSIGGAVTFTTSSSYTYKVPYRKKGAIFCYGYGDKYSFTDCQSYDFGVNDPNDPLDFKIRYVNGTGTRLTRSEIKFVLQAI